MKRKVLIVYPGLNLNIDEGAKHRLNSYINAYYKAGYDVEILGFLKTYWFTLNKKSLVDSKAKWRFRIYPLPISRHYLLTKLLEWWLKISVAIQTNIRQYDVVQMETLSCRSTLCNKRSRYITDFHGDLVHEYCEMKGVSQKHWFVKWALRMQKQSVATSDICIYVSENLKIQIEKNTGIKGQHHVVVSCGIDMEKFSSAQAPPAIAEKLKERIVVGYSGGLHKWQNIEKIIDLAMCLSAVDNRIFLMIYTNSDISSYQSKLNALGANNYEVMALKSAEVPTYLKLLDVGLLIRDNMVLNIVSSPTKICEYLAAGLPLVCTQFSGDYARSIVNGETGYVLNSSIATATELSELLCFLQDVKENPRKYSERCLEKVTQRTFEFEFATLIDKMGNFKKI